MRMEHPTVLDFEHSIWPLHNANWTLWLNVAFRHSGQNQIFSNFSIFFFVNVVFILNREHEHNTIKIILL
jgi:hypothetical protein